MLPAPATIGHYRILSKLGEGGMGAVYRATDTTLNRDVAIKVLPPAFAEDAARLARFEREAQILAALNHPNIAAIYGIERCALVMELVEGPDLAGPVPIDTALAYARQIAAGLEAAHEKGIVHRDLKPANIKVTPDGKLKILDFGLAKATEEAASASGVSPTLSPTLSLAMTQAGMILGTAAYMAPEQARGKPVDKRADIWAFGVILYELLTGTQPFVTGDTVTDIIAAVLTREPDFAQLPKETQPHIVRLLRRCLRKDPKLRLRDIGEARIALDEPAEAAAPQQPAAKWWLLPWAAAAVALVAGLGAGFLWFRSQPPEAVPIRFHLRLPDGATLANNPATPQAVPSPDGRFIAFIATSNNKRSLWIRPMASPAAHRLEKTEDANCPFWSPDGQFIAFFAEGRLKKIPAAGGSPQTISAVNLSDPNAGEGGAWSPDGDIVFSQGQGSPLMRVPAAAGLPTAVTKLDSSAGEFRHSWPQFLPDGRHLLYFVQSADSAKTGIYVQELGTLEKRLVLRNLLRGAWSKPGYLLFPRESNLFAQRMDPESFRLSGEPIAIAEGLTSNEANGRSAFAVSLDGTLVYRSGDLMSSGQLAWYARDGRRLGPVGQPGAFQSIRLSPDEKTLALAVGTVNAGDTWMMDLATGVLARMTSDGLTSPAIGAWSPDSKRFAVNLRISMGIQELTLASVRTRPLVAGILAEDWSPDGRFLLCRNGRGTQLTTLSVDNSPHPQIVNNAPYARSGFRFSPDGRFVAYASLEPGGFEIFVASFPTFAQKRKVSSGGGDFPMWRKDGKELFFQEPDGTIMSADIDTARDIQSSLPIKLFKIVSPSWPYPRYAPSGDGKRFLVFESQQFRPAETTVVVNWSSELKQR